MRRVSTLLRQIFVITVLVGFAGVLTHADPLTCSIEETQAALKAQTILMREAERIRAMGIDESTATDEVLADQLRITIRELTESYVGYPTPEIEKSLKFIKFKVLASYARKLGHSMGLTRTSIRLNGRSRAFGIAVAWLAGYGMDAVVINLLVHVLHVPLAAASFSVEIPWSIPLQNVRCMIENLAARKKLIQIYGGEETFEEVREAERAASEELNLHSTSEWLVPTTLQDGTVVGPVASKSKGMAKKALSAVGWDDQHLTYEGLDHFCSEHGESDIFIEGLRADPNLPKQFKLVLLLRHLADTRPPELFYEIQETFSAGFAEIKALGDYSRLREWCLKGLRVETISDLRDLIRTVPADANPKQVIALWREMIFPDLASRNIRQLADLKSPKAIQLADYRRLANNLQILKAKSDQSMDAVWGAEWDKNFSDYFGASIKSSSYCNAMLTGN